MCEFFHIHCFICILCQLWASHFRLNEIEIWKKMTLLDHTTKAIVYMFM